LRVPEFTRLITITVVAELDCMIAVKIAPRRAPYAGF